MYLDHIQSQLLPLTSPRSTLDLSNLAQLPIVFGFFFFGNLLNPLYAAHILMSVEPSSGVWSIY